VPRHVKEPALDCGDLGDSLARLFNFENKYSDSGVAEKT